MTMQDEKKALFIGRWQPFHNGHRWLIDKKLAEGIPCLVAVRDIPPDVRNPFTTKQTVLMLQTVFSGENVDVIVIPDIESVNYGRGVGYEVNEHIPPKDVGFISATSIRDQIKLGKDDWKKNVDPKIHDQIIQMMTY